MTRAPGPPAYRLFRNIRDFRRDILDLLLRSSREYGDVVRFSLGPRVMHLVNHPDLVARVLDHPNFERSSRSAEKLKFVCGRSLLTTDGEFWKHERELLQPAFHSRRVEGFAPAVAAETEAWLDRWSPGRPLDVASEMIRLTSGIVGKTFFSADLSGSIGALERALAVILEHTYRRFEAVLDWDGLFPALANPRYREAVRTVEGVVEGLLRDHRRADGVRNDLLGLLIEAAGDRMDDVQLRNETVTLLLAGYETTAHALAWTFHLLASNPVAEARAREEAKDVSSSLAFTTQAIRESLRLYPPIWAVERRVLRDDEIGGYEIPSGSSIFVSPYALHRHSAFWENPEAFDPDRFSPERSARRPTHAYLPFGAGPHQCIGSGLALMEMKVIVPRVLRRFRLKPLPDPPVVPRPGITLRFKHGLPMVPEAAP